MSYVKSTLLPGEKILHYATPHWVVLLPGMMAMVLALIVYELGVNYFPHPIPEPLLRISVETIIAYILLAFGLYQFLVGLIFYYSSEYAVTDRRIVMKTGWVQRRTLELFLDKCEAVRVDQSVLGRVLKYGAVIIIGTGGTRDGFAAVPSPLDFRQKAQISITNYTQRQHAGTL